MSAPAASIGPMRRRVEVQARAIGADSFGAPVATWSTVATVWAQVMPLSGRELWQAQQVRPDVTHKVTMRYFDGLTSRHRLKVGTRVLHIESVINPDGRSRFHECVCKEEVS